MRTGSRPSTSSTCTSRTWRAKSTEPASSSKTVGSVRTGMPRSRHARTTRIAQLPGAEGIAMITSSGSASSRIRGSSRVVAAHAHAVDAQPLLERVVVDEADRVQAELGLRASSGRPGARPGRRRRSARCARRRARAEAPAAGGR